MLSPLDVRILPQRAEHADEMFTLLQDPALYEHEGEPPASLEWLRERFARLESGHSADGSEQWLNWVAQLSSGELIGYVWEYLAKEGRGPSQPGAAS